jgi:carbonic anhydrase
MKSLSLIALLLLSATLVLSRAPRQLQSLEDFTYSSHGGDWDGTCSSGSLQSPINIDPSGITCDKSMMFEMTFNNDITLTLSQSTLAINGTGNTPMSELFATDINGILTGYEAESFVLRYPAEHQIDDTSYDLELQIVHYIKDSFEVKGLTNKKYAIVSILFSADGSSSNAFIDALGISSIGTGAVLLNVDVQTLLGDVLPTTIPYYTYQGSFTTPTCKENVNWYIVESIQSVTSSQLSSIKTLIGSKGNNRALQDSNDRTIKKGNVDCEEQFVYFFSFLILYIFINYFIFKLL